MVRAFSFLITLLLSMAAMADASDSFDKVPARSVVANCNGELGGETIKAVVYQVDGTLRAQTSFSGEFGGTAQVNDLTAVQENGTLTYKDSFGFNLTIDLTDFHRKWRGSRPEDTYGSKLTDPALAAISVPVACSLKK